MVLGIGQTLHEPYFPDLQHRPPGQDYSEVSEAFPSGAEFKGASRNFVIKIKNTLIQSFIKVKINAKNPC